MTTAPGTRDHRASHMGEPMRKPVVPADEVVPALDDFRSDEQRQADEHLLGTWHRCRVHGLTQDALWVGPVAYCPADDCSEAVLLVHSRAKDPTDKPAFNSMAVTPRARPVKEESVTKRAGPGRNVREIILELLRVDAATTREAIDAAIERERPGMKRGPIGASLFHMAKGGTIEQDADGNWRLSAAGDEGAGSPGQDDGDRLSNTPAPELTAEATPATDDQPEPDDVDDLVDEADLPELRFIIEQDGQVEFEAYVRGASTEIRTAVLTAILTAHAGA